MNEGVEITQNASLGAKETVQVGIQNNINNVQVGLTPSNAVEMALGIFREHYPQLKQEALAEVKQLVIEEMKKIQPEDIIPPTPKIAVPILQNASITEEQELRRLYARLLSNSMNRTVKNKVYPGFVEVLNQLCVDEAKLLPYIYTKKVIPTITLRRESKDKNGEGADVIKNFSDIGEHVKCENPLNINLYFDNLIRLGLLERSPAFSSLTDKTLYESLKTHPYIVAKKESIHQYAEPYNQPAFSEGYMLLTDFGREFCEKTVIEIVTIHLPPIQL